jgi:hypothetical protein
MSGPRNGGRGRSKCMIRNEIIIDEGRNRFQRAPQQTSACARRARMLGASPRASGRPLGLGGAPPSPRGPPALTSRSAGRARVGAAAAATPPLARRGPRGPREGQAGELQRATSPLSNFVKPVRRDAAAAAAQRLADLRAQRDDQRAKEAEVAAHEAEHRPRPMRADGLPHACGGRLSGCGPACCMLHAGCGPDAAWAVASWGKGRGGGLSVDRLPPLTHVLGRLLFYSGAKAECGGRCLGCGSLGQRLHVVKLI